MNPAPTTPFRHRFGIIAAGAVCFLVGAAGMAAAHSDDFAGVAAPTTVDDTVVDDTVVDDTVVDDTVVDDTLVDDTLVDDTVVDDDSDTSTTTPDSDDDDSDDDSDTSTTTPDSDDDDSDTSTTSPSTTTPKSLPDPFTQTYNSAGGSINVTWTGTAFVLNSIDPAAGFGVEIEDQRWDRIKVDFDGDDRDSRIEVRLSDDDWSIRVRID